MHLVDILILVCLLLFLLKGLWRGLLRQVCSLVGLAGGVLLAVWYARPLALYLDRWLPMADEVAVVVTFLLLLILVWLLFLIIGMLLSRFIKKIKLGGLNRVLGGFFALVQGVVVVALLVHLGSRLPSATLRGAVTGAQLSPPFISLGKTLVEAGQGAVRR